MNQRPSFSVIVPAHGRPVRLALCLAALGGQTYPRDRFEVIVVDDGSPVRLDRVVAQFGAQPTVRLVRQAWQGPAAARNAGAAAACGSFLAFTDDDCAPGQEWLAHLAVVLRNDPGAAAGGRVVNAAPGNPYAAASQWIVDCLYRASNPDPLHAGFLASNNLGVAADAFRALGGFDTQYRHAGGEDRDWCDRWQCTGGRLVYAPRAVIYHLPRLGGASFWRQHFRYGRGAYRFHLAQARGARAALRIAPARFYLDLLRGAWARSEFGFLPKTRSLAVVGLAQAATAAGFAAEATGWSEHAGCRRDGTIRSTGPFGGDHE